MQDYLMQDEPKINWKRYAMIAGGTLLALIVLIVAFYLIFLNFFVDWWWFDSLKFEGYFFLRLIYRFILSGGVTVLFFGIFFFHFWLASRYLGLNASSEAFADPKKRQRYQRFSEQFMSGSLKIYTPLSLVLAVVIAIPFYEQWESALLFVFGGTSTVTEPVYDYDIGFYLMRYPLFLVIQKELLITALLLFFMVAILYFIEHSFVPDQEQDYPLGAKVHLTILLGFVVFFVVWGFLLERFSLLYYDNHEPVFFGPGFIEIRYQLPLIWLSIVVFVCASLAAMVFFFHRDRISRNIAGVLFLCFFAVIGLRKVQFIPDIITSLIVKPNPVTTEQMFMKNNIDATLDAYDLKKINTIEYEVAVDATNDIESWADQQHFENIPVWDRNFLTDVYQQLQGIRPYYIFPSVDEDRYFLHEHKQQVNLAAREINVSKLPKEAQNWENIHMRYTHGFGSVVTPAAQDAGKPIVWYLRDLNLFSDVGFEIDKPDIYYGQEDLEYAIVPNKLEVIGLSGADSALTGDYKGDGGIPIGSFFRKLLFAVYMSDEKIFFSVNVSRKSRMRIRRNIRERVKTLAPYLHLDNDPYLVISDDRLYWIMDAYTISDWYPVSEHVSNHFLSGEEDFNYIRNSVKVVVDAYDGGVDFYIADPSDVLIMAYNRAYPGVFKNLDKLPESLQTHLRYPRDLFYLQMKLYAKFHQIEPQLFYEQAETWQFAEVNGKPVLPYYITMDFDNCDDWEEFVMVNPMTPINRDNLSMVALAGVLDNDNCTKAYVPSITIYKFFKDVQVNGPAQVEALIDQNPEISEQFTLWDQHGSKVEKGRMIIIPMGDHSVLYVQPIYMISTKTKIPELTRVIVSIGNEVVMDTTLTSAFARLKERFQRGAAIEGGSGTSGISEIQPESTTELPAIDSEGDAQKPLLIP